MTDPFEFLGLRRQYRLDPSAVHQAYLRCAALAHPDMVGESEEESAQSAAELNDAKRLLEDPELRADVLLRLLGGPSKESDRTLPAGFLQEMMERGEQVEEVRASRDASRLKEMLGWAAEERRKRQDSVAEFFDRVESGDRTFLKRVREELNAWRYIERLVEQLRGDGGGGAGDERRG